MNSRRYECFVQLCSWFICTVFFTETMAFVDKLFECLSSKSYLGITSDKDVSKEEVKPVVVKPDAVEVRVIHRHSVFWQLIIIIQWAFGWKVEHGVNMLHGFILKYLFIPWSLKLQWKTEKTGGGKVPRETALTSVTPGLLLICIFFFLMYLASLLLCGSE